MMSYKYVLTWTRKLLTRSQKKGEKAENISKLNHCYIPEKRHVKLLLMKIVVKKYLQKTRDHKASHEKKHYVLRLHQ